MLPPFSLDDSRDPKMNDIENGNKSDQLDYFTSDPK